MPYHFMETCISLPFYTSVFTLYYDNPSLLYLLFLLRPATARWVMSFFSAKLDCPIVILSSAALLFL